jgi:RNA polymerase sigma factor (sigma-70 family)
MKEVSFRNDILPLKDILYRLALRITLNRAEAEDIVQDTLLKVWNRRDDWSQMDNIEAYSMTVCRNLALDRIERADNRTDSLDDSGTERPDTASNPLEHASQLDSIEIVRSLIDHLPEKQRSCIQLRDFEGRSYKEIARVLNISEEQVKVNIFRARQTIKLKFQQYDNYGL